MIVFIFNKLDTFIIISVVQNKLYFIILLEMDWFNYLKNSKYN